MRVGMRFEPTQKLIDLVGLSEKLKRDGLEVNFIDLEDAVNLIYPIVESTGRPLIEIFDEHFMVHKGSVVRMYSA